MQALNKAYRGKHLNINLYSKKQETRVKKQDSCFLALAS